MNKAIKGKNILVTGACGTIGSELIRQLINSKIYKPAKIVGLDNNENAVFLINEKYSNVQKANFFVSDIRNLDELISKSRNIDIIFHTAALKHVFLSEKSPEEVIRTNINGIQNLIIAAKENNIKKVIFTSSDKAVNPTNVMGASKLMGERLITASNHLLDKISTIFVSTRFGNVLGSNGSVVSVFYDQIINGRPITLTDEKMTRFIMSVSDAVKLVIDSADHATGGEVFVTKMPVIRIADLALAMYEILAPLHKKKEKIKIVKIGPKPGEKLYEELLNSEEVRRSIEHKNYYIILPAIRSTKLNIKYNYKNIISKKVKNIYSSHEGPFLKIPEIKQLLIKNKVLEKFNSSHSNKVRK